MLTRSSNAVSVHGDIRHLETRIMSKMVLPDVHGDIRHLETHQNNFIHVHAVHGDIRHLEG